ncbi:MAG: putative Holliday junction resolvase [Deltaproteobacteria bacterium]|jgi:putative Holliday junction resolvase|nr:putative Holliday junction resolvase [Deltaproteobacteria bacterium]
MASYGTYTQIMEAMGDNLSGERVLGLDYGSRRIGVAVSDPLGLTVQPLPPIPREGDRKDIVVLARLASEMGVTSVVLGLPLLLNGDEGPAAIRARAFGERLQAETSLPVTMWDERLTSVQSERHLIASGVRRADRRGIRDSLSAMLLLQAALDSRRRR